MVCVSVYLLRHIFSTLTDLKERGYFETHTVDYLVVYLLVCITKLPSFLSSGEIVWQASSSFFLGREILCLYSKSNCV